MCDPGEPLVNDLLQLGIDLVARAALERDELSDLGATLGKRDSRGGVVGQQGVILEVVGRESLGKDLGGVVWPTRERLARDVVLSQHLGRIER